MSGLFDGPATAASRFFYSHTPESNYQGFVTQPVCELASLTLMPISQPFHLAGFRSAPEEEKAISLKIFTLPASS